MKNVSNSTKTCPEYEKCLVTLTLRATGRILSKESCLINLSWHT